MFYREDCLCVHIVLQEQTTLNIVCRHMQDDLAHALIDVLEYTSNQINVYSLRQETSGKLQTLQGAGHFRNAANVLQTLTRLVS